MTLFYLFLGFNIWMVVDAVRRRADLVWLLLLLLVPPAALVYFFTVKIHDYNFRRLRRKGGAKGSSTPSIPALRQRAEAGGDLDAQLELADALEAEDQAAEAIGIYEKVLSHEARHPAALHGLARCHLSLGKPRLAAENLEQVLEQDPRFRNYSAALDYAEALWQAGERNDAIELMEGMVRDSGRPNHRLALAHYAQLAGAPALAREQLERLLSEHASDNSLTQRQNEHWAARARDMLAEVERSDKLLH